MIQVGTDFIIFGTDFIIFGTEFIIFGTQPFGTDFINLVQISLFWYRFHYFWYRFHYFWYTTQVGTDFIIFGTCINYHQLIKTV